MSSNNLNAYKEYFIKMAKGEIPYSQFYIVKSASNNIKQPVNVTMVAPTEQAVEQAKSELRTNSSKKPIRETNSKKKTIRGTKRSRGAEIFTKDNKKRKPPGTKILNTKTQLWN